MGIARLCHFHDLLNHQIDLGDINGRACFLF